ncbi:17-beta-hydroxysteroid dehydrogenase type 3 isoform 2-T2 [Pholidichthys leucotaenia]
MNIVIMSRTKANLDELAEEISETTGQSVKVIVADFTSENVFEAFENQIKDLDIGVLVNNVGMLPSIIPSKFLDYKDLDKTITKLINCNVKTMTKMCKMILPGMEKRRKGLIVNISSGIATVPLPLYTLYGASKVFVERLSQGLQAEYKDKGITVQAVAPFGVSTRMTGYQKTNIMTLSPEDFVKSSLQYLRAGDKTYGSVCHIAVAWLLLTIPLKFLYAETVMQSLQDFVRNRVASVSGSGATTERHPSIHPSSTAFPEVRVAEAAVQAEKPRLPSPQPPAPALQRGYQGVPRPAGRHSLSTESWVCPGVSSQWDVPETPQVGGVQEAS